MVACVFATSNFNFVQFDNWILLPEKEDSFCVTIGVTQLLIFYKEAFFVFRNKPEEALSIMCFSVNPVLLEVSHYVKCFLSNLPIETFPILLCYEDFYCS